MYSYLALGDSYTVGESIPIADSFPYQTAYTLRNNALQVTEPVIIARTGWTTDELAAAIRERELQESFSFVTLLIGVNNQYRGRTVEDFRPEATSLLNQAIVFANGHSRHVFVLSIPDWGATPFAEGRDRQGISHQIDAYNAACKEIAMAHKCNYLDITDSTRANGQKNDFLAVDGLHPSVKEYAVWAESLAPLIAKCLKS